MSEAVPSIMAQSWPWGSQIAVKKKKVHVTPILEVIFVIITENSSVIANDNHNIQPEIAVGMHFHV